MNKIIGLFVFVVIVALAMAQLGERAAVGAGTRAASAGAVSAPVSAQSARSGGVVILDADRSGHFVASIQVEGTFVRSIVDTGATLVAFSHEDAARAGVHPRPGDRKARFATANGPVDATITRVGEIRLDNLVVRDVEAAIMPRGALQGTLLGMSFLRQLSFESRGSTMVLRQ